MLATLSLLAAPFQVGAPPMQGPSGGYLQVVDVGSWSGQPQILTAETLGTSTAHHVYGIDASGALALQSSVPAKLGITDAFSIEENRIACRDSTGATRMIVGNGPTWIQGPRLRGDLVFGSFQGPGAADLHGDRVAHSLFGSDVISVQDLSSPGAVVPEAELPTRPGTRTIDLDLDGDLLVALSGSFDPQTGRYLNQEITVYENLDIFGWTSVASPLPAPSGLDWSDEAMDVALQSSRIAVAVGNCGSVFLYERTPNGAFGLADVLTSRRDLEWAPAQCFGATKIALDGDSLAMTTGGDSAGERFERTPNGWQAREIVRSDLGATRGYDFAGDFLISSSGSGGVQVHPPVDVETGWEITCPAASPLEPQYLFASPLGTHGLAEVAIYSGDTSVFDIDFLIVGFRSGQRALGPESKLCIGGPLRIVRLADGGTVGVGKLRFDPTSSGIAPGDTVHFQGWQRTPGRPAGRTSNAIAVTF